MRKRSFIFTALSAAVAPAFAKNRMATPKEAGPTLLTISGAIGHGNRGAVDPALDQMMHKQGVQFDRAYTFNFDALVALPSVEISPTLEYDNQHHTLRGPLLAELVAIAGAANSPQNTAVNLRGVDGYVVQVSRADLRKYRFIVATHLDGQPMPLGGLGPLWAIYDADRFIETEARPLSARFTQCPWALYHIEILAA